MWDPEDRDRGEGKGARKGEHREELTLRPSTPNPEQGLQRTGEQKGREQVPKFLWTQSAVKATQCRRTRVPWVPLNSGSTSYWLGDLGQVT